MTSLIKLGFRRPPKRSLRDLFYPPQPLESKPHHPIKPDIDYHPEAEREPRAPNYTQMWTDHFGNMGNVHNPLGSPMESH
jgi:hypothetical protein